MVSDALTRVLRDSRGAVGPLATPLYGLVLVMLTVGLVGAAGVVGGVIRDQAAYASVLDSAATEAAHAVSTRALAAGVAKLDTSTAAAAFQGFLTSPTGGDLSQAGGSTYTLGGGGPLATNAPTAGKLSVFAQALTASPPQISVQGSFTDQVPAPVIGPMTVTMPESVTVVPKAVWANALNPQG